MIRTIVFCFVKIIMYKWQKYGNSDICVTTLFVMRFSKKNMDYGHNR